WTQLKERYQSRNDVPREEWKAVVHDIEVKQRILEERQVVKEAGGLHVIGTERHEAKRIDRQLAGRAGRQGDRGRSQFFMSLDDELLEGLGPNRQETLRQRGIRGITGPLRAYVSTFQKAQRKVEARHYRQRLDLMVYERNRQEILKDLGADPYVD